MLLYIKGCKRSFFFARKVRLHGLPEAGTVRLRGNGARLRRHGGSRRNQTNSAYCWRFGMRTRITLSCTECKQRNYNTTKDKKTHPERLEMKKYCRFCRKHTVHKETK